MLPLLDDVECVTETGTAAAVLDLPAAAEPSSSKGGLSAILRTAEKAEEDDAGGPGLRKAEVFEVEEEDIAKGRKEEDDEWSCAGADCRACEEEDE
jgi:hypothetical protein